MRVSAWNIYGILLLLAWLEGTLAAKKKNHQCPIGFQLAFTDSGLPICYRQKGPEAFHEKFKDCTGNLYSSKLYHNLNFTKTKQVLWTEYKSLYPGGPFIDWSYTDSTGDILRTTYNVKYDSSLGLDEELCVLIDPVSNFTAARCNERYFRYCFVEPYDEDDRSKKGCADFAGSWRFYSPYSTCLSAVTGVGGGTVRATWRQAQDLCAKRGGSLLNRGWRYSNSPLLHTSGSLPVYPLGIMTNLNHTLLRYDTENDTSEIPFEEWHFQDKYMSPDTTLGAVRNEFWRLVNGSFVFFDVICERPYHIQTVAMNLTVDWENNMLLSVDGDIKKSDINCFTDSMIYYPNKVSISKIEDDVIPHIFRVIPAFDGYYWCVQTFQQRYYPSESNKALFIRSKEAVTNLYAVKIHLRKEYQFDNLDKLNRVWKKKLDEFIYYRTKYLAVYGEVPGNDTEEVLKTFKNDRPDLDWKDTEVIYNLKIRRLFLDAKTALVHVLLNSDMKPLSPGMWDNLQVIFMKPAYFCNGFESVPTTELGNSVVSTRCRTFTCVGDFNDGVQWVETATTNCTTKLPVTKIADIVIASLPETATDPPEPTTMETFFFSQLVGLNNTSNNSTDNSTAASKSTESDSSDENDTTTPCLTVVTTETDWTFPDNFTPTTDIPSTTPPTTTLEPLAPEEQLQQVLDDLEQLLLNDTAPTLESIDQPFDLVNDILEEQQEGLEIPGQLLHLLDRIASKVQLEGEKQAITVRNNVAIMMADVTPDNPLRGVRVAARDYDAFSNTSFGFIDSSLKESQLQTNESEAVVFLPESVFATPRRISFVAFRNQRAFQSPMQINSRVFSVNVENLTMFENGEALLLVNFKGCNIYPELHTSRFTDVQQISAEAEKYFDYRELILAWAKPQRSYSITLKYDKTIVNFRYDGRSLNIECDNYDKKRAVGYLQFSESRKDPIRERLTPPLVMFLRSEEKVGQVLDDLEVLLQNETVPMTDDHIGQVMDQVDDLLEEQREVKIPGELLQRLDQLGSRFILQEDQKCQVIRSNFAVLSANISPESGVRGVRMASSQDGMFHNDSFEFVTDSYKDHMFSNESDAIAVLPESVTRFRRRISFVAFRNDRAFQNTDDCELNSKVFSINVEDFTGFAEGEMVEIYLRPLQREIKRNQSRACAHWRFNEDGSGYWSQEGCSLFISETGMLDVCRCDHLTHFAEILVRRNVFSQRNEDILEIISVIGCCFSIFGITIVALTAAVFKSWRTNDSNKVWLSLCSAVFILNICFLVTVYVKFDQSDISCTIVGVALHYSVLATFCWMLVISILSYRKLVLVFGADFRNKLFICSAFSWGFPLLVIGILLAVNSRSYSGKYEEMTPSGSFCYPKGIALWVTVFLPIGIMWFVNWILYGIIIRSMFENSDIRKSNDSKDTLRTASVSCLLAFLCGIPWIFGFFAQNMVAAYLFTITVTFQGFILFVFFILGTKKTRGLWLQFFRSKLLRKVQVTSTDISSRSQTTDRPRFYVDESSSTLLSEETRF